MNLNSFEFSEYKETIISQSVEAADTFLTGSNPEYWSGMGDNHGVIVGYDWVPHSGSLKLLEFNTNIHVTQAKTLDPAIEWFKEKNYNTIVLVVRNDSGMEIPNSSVVNEFTASLQNNGLTASIYTQEAWPSPVPEFDVPDNVFILRFGFDSASPIDYLASDKREFRNFASSSGFEYLMPRKMADLPDGFSNGTGIPDVIIKDPTEDEQTLLMNEFLFYDITSENKEYLLSQDYCEEFIEPDLNYNGAYYSELRSEMMLTPTENVFLTPLVSPDISLEISKQNLPYYTLNSDSGSYSVSTITRRTILKDSQILMSDDTYTNVENVITGSFLKIRNIVGLPDESDGVAYRCGNPYWRLWETSSLSIPSQSNVSVESVRSGYTDSYTLINGDKKFGTFEYLFSSGSGRHWSFKPSIKLSVGDCLADEDGLPLEITSISIVSSSNLIECYVPNVEPQDYYYCNGVIVHNACAGNLWLDSPARYEQYDEVYYPKNVYPTCNYYSNVNNNVGNRPRCETDPAGNITSCDSDGNWIAKGTCTPPWGGTTLNLQARWDARENLNTSTWSVATTDGGSFGSLTHQNSPSINTDEAPYYVSYDGSNDRSTSSTNINVTSGMGWTLTWWLKDTGNQSAGYERILGVSSYRLDVAEQNSSHKIRIYDGSWRTSTLTITSADSWTHLALVYSGLNDSLKLYEDASLVSTNSNWGRWINNKSYALGAKPGGGENWKGIIGQFCIYYGELSSSEITNNYDADRGYFTS
jgi:hypothetical protein